VSLEPPREAKAAMKVPTGARLRVTIPPPRKVDLTPEDIPIEILFEDNNIAVIDKPAGLAVHPAPEQVGHTLVNALLFHLRNLSGIGGEERPGIVHRLDKETSGVLLVAKNDFAHHALACQFKERLIHKTYLAIARGEPVGWEGRIDYALGRSYTHTKKQMIRVDGTGRPAVTDYRILEVFRGYALIELYPLTGRTHQIRVHLASLRLPVACDKLYGREKKAYLSELRGRARDPGEPPLIERQALHAASISFRHPLTRDEMVFSSPLPGDMQRLLKALQEHRSIR
jgi:23S rRNA pseudouridine1911/1915/1917 synthase